MIARVDRGGFDALALHRAMDEQRRLRGLTWREAADEIWKQSHVLNERRRDHPISPSTLTGIATRGDTTCQHALFILRWLERAPESFLRPGARDVADATLPAAGPDRRLRWNLRRLYDALDEERRRRALTWKEAAAEIRCSGNQLTGIRTARYAIGMVLAMRIVQWLGRPAAAFVDVSDW